MPLMTVPGGGVPARQHTRQGQMLPDRFLRWSCHLPSGQQCGSGARLHAVLSQGAAGGPMPGLWFGLHAPRVRGQAGRFPSVCSQLRSAFLVGPSVSATRWVPDVFWTRGLVGPRWALPPVGFAFSTLSLERRCSVMMPPGCRLHPEVGLRFQTSQVVPDHLEKRVCQLFVTLTASLHLPHPSGVCSRPLGQAHGGVRVCRLAFSELR